MFSHFADGVLNKGVCLAEDLACFFARVLYNAAALLLDGGQAFFVVLAQPFCLGMFFRSGAMSGLGFGAELLHGVDTLLEFAVTISEVAGGAFNDDIGQSNGLCQMEGIGVSRHTIQKPEGWLHLLVIEFQRCVGDR